MKNRSSFSGKLGFVLSAAGSAVGLGNIWRFPYFTAKYGGGIFLLVYIILVAFFGYTMIVSETSIGRIAKKSPVGAFRDLGKTKSMKFGGWINAIIPILIVPYYSVIGGWVLKYLIEYIRGNAAVIASDGYFTDFITGGTQSEIYFLIFAAMTIFVIYCGVQSGIERVSKFMMPVLIVLAIIISVFSCTRPGAVEGIKYLFIPNVEHFSWITVVAAMEQMFYSLSIAMGILITFGSYMKRDIKIQNATIQVAVLDTVIAILAGLMIIPAVFAFSGGDPAMLQAGPSLMFIIIPKVFASMGFGTGVGILFFVLVLFAALTSAISLCESAVSTFEDELGFSRHKASALMAVIMAVLGSLSALGYGPFASAKIFSLQFLDFFDFITNSVMMPISALFICVLIFRHIGVKRVAEEVEYDGGKFSQKKIYGFMVKVLCPIFVIVILIASILSMTGKISF